MDGAESCAALVAKKTVITRPVKELKAFGKAFVKKGETQTSI
jgi:hypothetical protein